jgi:hypothetical protein
MSYPIIWQTVKSLKYKPTYGFVLPGLFVLLAFAAGWALGNISAARRCEALVDTHVERVNEILDGR